MKNSGGWGNKKGTRQDRGYGKFWGKLRKHAINRDKGLCQVCLRSGRLKSFDEVDHIKPKAFGGQDELENLQCICSECHQLKTSDEAASAKGYRIRPVVGSDGWPVDR